MDVGKPPCWDGHLLDGSAWLAGHFGLLAELAVPGPICNGVVESLFNVTVYLRIKDCSGMNI